MRAASRTGYYGGLFRQAGLEPGDHFREQDLPRLPVLEKATLHAAEERGMLAEPAARLSAVTTSGSTGQPLKVLRSARDQAEVSALWARVLHAFGHGFFDSQVNISTGRSVARTGPVALLRRLGVLPQIRQVSSFEPVDRQIEILREQQPHTFSAYAISLEMIADALLEQGITDIRPKVVFSAAMPLSDRGRATRGGSLRCGAARRLRGGRTGPIGWECPERARDPAPERRHADRRDPGRG